MTTDPNDCQGCEGRGQLTVDGVAFATCDACAGTGKCPRQRPVASGLGGMDIWADPGYQKPMQAIHDEMRRKRAARRPVGRGTG